MQVTFVRLLSYFRRPKNTFLSYLCHPTDLSPQKNTELLQLIYVNTTYAKTMYTNDVFSPKLTPELFPNLSELKMTGLTCGFVYILSWQR